MAAHTVIDIVPLSASVAMDVVASIVAVALMVVVVAVMAVDALGANQVEAVMMPSPYTSQDSLDDAAELAKRLGIRLDEIDIANAMDATHTVLADSFDRGNADLAKENL